MADNDDKSSANRTVIPIPIDSTGVGEAVGILVGFSVGLVREAAKGAAGLEVGFRVLGSGESYGTRVGEEIG